MFKRTPKVKDDFGRKITVKDLEKMWQNPKTRRVFLVSTKRPGPNMPKAQPCPECRLRSRRGQKLTIGAYYMCSNHGEFVVINPVLAKRQKVLEALRSR